MHCQLSAFLVTRMNDTKVYIADTDILNDEKLFGELYETVSPVRQKKTDAFIFQKDKKLCLAAELLLNKALSYEGIEKYIVEYGQYGKPYLENEKVFFNLSHSEDMVMCAVSSCEVGCDVEKVADIDLDIARRFFYASEYGAIISAQNRFERNDIFFRLWTLKESYMKATGLGMNLPLDGFRVNIHQENITVCKDDVTESYFFREYDFNNGYKYAVCSGTRNIADARFVSLV